MKFSADRKNFSDTLAQIQGITGRKTNLAITSDVLIQASGSEVIITANDLETVFQGRYEAEVESDGIISINAKKIYEIVREYPDFDIPIEEIENRWVEIGKDNIQYHIVSSDYKNFPETPRIDEIPYVEISAKNFKKMIDVSTAIGFSQDEKRIYVRGALMESVQDEDGTKIRMVSTDSRRLNCFDVAIEGDLILPDENVLIPKKGLTELGKFLGGEDTVKLGVKDNHLIVKKKNEIVMIKLLEGDYPDYRRVINTDNMVPIDMDKAMFMMVMKRMSILASEDYKSVLFTFKENELIVTITNPDIGESKEEMVIGYSGDLVESAFNPRFFIDALNAIEGENFVMHIKDNKNPCILTENNNKLICAIMAMSV